MNAEQNDCRVEYDASAASHPSDDRCSGCGQRSSCGSVYQTLGAAQGPSVFGKSLIAFALPVVVFVVALAAGERVLRAWIRDPDLRMLVGILPALATSIVGVGAARRIFLSGAACDRQGEPSSRSETKEPFPAGSIRRSIKS